MVRKLKSTDSYWEPKPLSQKELIDRAVRKAVRLSLTYTFLESEANHIAMKQMVQGVSIDVIASKAFELSRSGFTKGGSDYLARRALEAILTPEDSRYESTLEAVKGEVKNNSQTRRDYIHAVSTHIRCLPFHPNYA